MNSFVICPVCHQTVTGYELTDLSNAATGTTGEAPRVEMRIAPHKNPRLRFDDCDGSGRLA